MKAKYEVRDGIRWCTLHNVQYTILGKRLRCPECNKVDDKRWKDANNYQARSQMWFWMKKCEAAYMLGGACVVCGEEDVSVLQFDHIRGDGHCEGVGRAGLYAVRWVLAHPAEASVKYQLLCANCHMRKTAKEAKDGRKKPCKEAA